MNSFVENRRIVEGAYRKFKSYYYYNKNFLVIKQKITEFESNDRSMEECLDSIANYLTKPYTSESKSFIEKIMSSIDFYVLPKQLRNEQTNISHSELITNESNKSESISSVNFFIDCDISLHILDTIWTIYLAKIAYDNNVLSYDSYGNTINNSGLFKDDNIIFDNLLLFNRYFPKYCMWRNKAFETIEYKYNKSEDSYLISVDIKSFFYSIPFDFNRMKKYLGNHSLFKKIAPLNSMMRKAFFVYFKSISAYRNDLPKMNKTSSILPIGLFSSMLLSNIFMSDFDQVVRESNLFSYYGRYVDDMLFVCEKTKTQLNVFDIMDEVFVKTKLLTHKNDEYMIAKRPSLKINSTKVKILYIDHNESRAIIDIYNEKVKMYPSQMEPVPLLTDSMQSFNLSVYDMGGLNEKFSKISELNTKSLETNKFFAQLPIKYTGIIQKETNEIKLLISQINSFFRGSNIIEYSSSWMYYLNFLFQTDNVSAARCFLKNIREYIQSIKHNSLDRNLFCKVRTINKKLKQYLNNQLEIALYLALALNYKCADEHFKSKTGKVKDYIKSNLFNHNLIVFPLANYLDYDKTVSFSSLSLKELGEYPTNLTLSHQFRWSPRFIHFEEIQCAYFYKCHINDQSEMNRYFKDMINDYMIVNHFSYNPISFKPSCKKLGDYTLRSVSIPTNRIKYPEKILVAIGSVDIKEEQCLDKDITINQKNTLIDILKDTYDYFIENKRDPGILVLPELYSSSMWINELIKFSKRSQIAVVTGIKHIESSNGIVHNYLATFLPYTSGKRKYKNIYIDIREKNDYSPIEFNNLAEKYKLRCRNKADAEYNVFNWNRIDIASIVCYELTDVMVRALFKGECDLIALPVYNPDTTYFSNIIEATVRDLHAFIIQANTSRFGDSRVTGPYDRDSKDIYKIKGGDNDHVVIGTINFGEVKYFETHYNDNQNQKIRDALTKKQGQTRKRQQKNAKKKIKPLSARFKNRYTREFNISDDLL